MRCLSRFLPANWLTLQGVGEHRLFRRWAPRLRDPRLWRGTRRGVALGAAVGVFFAFITPVAQIPCAVAASVALRAYIPVAAASTFVTNPLTFAPIYYLAYHTGGWAQTVLGFEGAAPVADFSLSGLVAAAGDVAIGLAVIACAGAALAYWLARVAWRVRAVVALRRRRLKRLPTARRV